MNEESAASEMNVQIDAVVRPRLHPITLKEAKEFVANNHRHNKPPTGWKFGVGLKIGDDLVGVATAGRPVARHYDDGLTLEVNRTCADGTRNANSMLYGAIWRAAKAIGYMRCITYTQADETGASLKAAGWVKVKELPPRKSWAESSVKMRYLSGVEVVGGYFRFLRLLYADTPYCCFFYGQSTANRIFWRFYWLTPNKGRYYS